MTPERWQQVNEMFHSALAHKPAQRAAFLDQACDGDQELRKEVESLIGSHEDPGSFIDVPALEAAGRWIAEDPTKFTTGQRIGHYKIVSLLGSGGMGEVYLAHDSKLSRNVALKLLPASFTQVQERVRRFKQEARAVSGLNHPNIITIHEVDQVDGIHFIATEYIEGDTLSQRINERDLRAGEAIDVAIEVAGALAAAHQAGIIHRDIKPENIMLRSDGYVKVLDFGLAKLTERETTATDTESSPVAALKTDTGAVMGTAHYMSPEQARGAAVDERTDIFSLGVVIYEMVTGHVPFEGETASHVIVSILEKEPPPLTDYLSKPPAELQRIISKALSKDKEGRYQLVTDLLIDLKNLKHELESGARFERSKKARHRRDHKTEYIVAVRALARRRLIWLVALVLMIGISVAAWFYMSRHVSEASPPPMKVVPFTSLPGREVHPAFSPDGNQIAFGWSGETDENLQLYVKQVGSEKSLRLTFSNPDWDYSPNWSPDGQRIAFVRFSKGDRTIFTVSALGGGSERKLLSLARGPRADRIDWSPDGKFIATPDLNSKQEPPSIFLISPETAEKRAVTICPAQSYGDYDPTFSPDSQTLAFVRWYTLNTSDLYLVPVAGGEPRRLTFDNMQISGLAWTPEGREIVFSSNRGGTPCLWRIPASGGTPERLAVGGDNAGRLSISRKGHRLAYSQGVRNINIYRIEVPGAPGHNNSPVKLIGSTRTQSSPQFSPDGKSIAFRSDRSGSPEIWMCDSEGLNPIQLTSFGGPEAGSPRWSPDGKRLVFESHAKGDADIYVLDVEGGLPRRITTDSSDDVVPSWSKDGRWIYFSSNRSGDYQVWKVPVEGGEAVQLTKQGGFVPFESADGKFVYYCKGLSVARLWRVPVEGGEETPVFNLRMSANWALVNDGIYFIDWVNTDALLPWEFAIEFFSFATQQITQVTYLGKVTINPGFAVSPDHRSILYTQVTPGDNDIMLVENFR